MVNCGTWLRYDAAGRPTSTTRPGGVTINSSYDTTGRITAQSGGGAEAATANRSYTYDGADRLLTATGANGTERYTYDDRGLLLTSSMPGWDTSFGYDADGQLTTQSDSTGVTGYGYDAAGRQTSQNDPLTGTTVTVGYNKLGQASTVAYGAAGATRSYGYDDLHQLTSDVLKNPAGTVQASVGYGYDTAGHLTSKTTSGVAGAGSNTYTYDDAGRLASWTAGTVTTPYTYDPAGNRTRAGPTTFTYNARSQLTAATNGSSTTSYSYTSRGTTAAITSGSSTTAITSDAYDQQISNGAAGYNYDALGRLVTFTTGAGSRSLAYGDLSNNVASDGSQQFSHTAEGGPLSAAIGGIGLFLNADQHGDVTGTFTPTGNSLAGSTSYDPYGTVLASTGTQPDVGYQGGWTDPATSFVNAASRWYSPATGAFTSADTQQNEPAPAVNANPYGNDAPLDNSDPSGHDACSANLAGAAALQAQRAAAQAAGKKWLEQAKADAQRRRDQEQAKRNRAGDPTRPNTLDGPDALPEFEFDDSPFTVHSSNHSDTDHWYNSPVTWVAGSVVVVVGLALTAEIWGPAVVVAGAAKTAEEIYALAASETLSCTPGNAPAKPKDKAPPRAKGPTEAPAGVQTAGQVPPGEGQPAPTPGDAPAPDTPPGGLNTQIDGACFTGALQRADGTRSAGIWECGDSAAPNDPDDSARAPSGGGNRGRAEVYLDPDEGETGHVSIRIHGVVDGAPFDSHTELVGRRQSFIQNFTGSLGSNTMVLDIPLLDPEIARDYVNRRLEKRRQACMT